MRGVNVVTAAEFSGTKIEMSFQVVLMILRKISHHPSPEELTESFKEN